MNEQALSWVILTLVLLIAFAGLYVVVKGPGRAYEQVKCCCYAVDNEGQLAGTYPRVESYKGNLYSCDDACRLSMDLPVGIHARGEEGTCPS